MTEKRPRLQANISSPQRRTARDPSRPSHNISGGAADHRPRIDQGR
jgi:hypothetical protein